MRKKLLFSMVILLTLVLFFLVTPVVQAATYTVGGKTITFEKFKPEGIDDKIIGILDYKDNDDGIVFGTEAEKIYHMNLDGTIEEMALEDVQKLMDEGKILEDYWIYCGYESEAPKEFSQDLPELTFVEGTGDNAGLYAVKIGEEIVSDYVYSDEFQVAKEGDTNFSLGNVILGSGINKDTNKVDLWMNTKTSSLVISADPENDSVEPSVDGSFLTAYVLNEKGNYDLIIFDWSGNEIMSLELTNDSYAYVQKINTYNQEFIQIDIETNDTIKTEVYDFKGNKVIETDNDTWLYALQFGMIQYYSYEEGTSKIAEFKNNTTISDVLKTEYLDLYATTAELKKTSEDYLAPGKYYFTTENGEVYEMTISYSILNGANASFDKTCAENLTVKADGDLEKLEGIYVDNEKLAESNYTLTSGSTIVTLKNEYLKTLKSGEYTLKVKYLDGEVETKFTITETIEKDEEPKMGINHTQNIVSYVGITLIIAVAFVVNKRIK